MRKYLVILFALSAGIFSCQEKKSSENISSEVEPDSTAIIVRPVNKDSLLKATAGEILQFLKNRQYDSLVAFFADSVHFSPYGFIGSGEQTLTATGFSLLLSSNKKVKWGDLDGSGEPINLTAKEYLESFVYNADFLVAEKMAVDSFIGSGNSLNNLRAAYPTARFIEYHFSGFEKKYEGMDWKSLRLVFRESDGKFLLVAFVNDRWTI